MNTTEYRIVWKREGRDEKRKFFWNYTDGAERLLTKLWTQPRPTLPKLEYARMETRLVGEWDRRRVTW